MRSQRKGIPGEERLEMSVRVIPILGGGEKEKEPGLGEISGGGSPGWSCVLKVRRL